MDTLKCLATAFAGESMARNRYTIYAKIAKKEGYVFISKIFLETAENEKEHAESLLKLMKSLNKDMNSITLSQELPANIGDTIENLKTSINGENYEHTKMYPEFAKIAEKEGHRKIGARLRAIAKAEEHHEERFKKLLEVLETGKMFKRDEETTWICLECGYVHHGKEPPEKCPSCEHEKGYFVPIDLLAI